MGGTDESEEKPGGTSTNEAASTVWNNLDCVLSHDKLKDLQTAWDLQMEQQQQYAKATAAFRVKPGDRLRLRRQSTGSENFGWLRELELRSDVPSIEEIRDWSFDPLEFEDSALVKVFVSMLEYYNLLDEFKLDRDTLEKYAVAVMHKHNKDCFYRQTDLEEEKITSASVVEDDTLDNLILCEYHNWYHAVSCAHVCFLFLTFGGGDQFLNSKDIFCIIMGGLIHDLDHPGNNNDFEVKRGTELAQRYSNESVLEMHSITEGLKLCKENAELDWLSSFENAEDREYVENFMAKAILATDPAKHGGVVREALAFLEKGPKSFGTGDEETYFDINNTQHRIFIGRLFLHSADISNPLHCSFEVARDWAVRVTTEFSRQAMKEKQLDLPVTSFMDGLDNEYTIAKVQISFFGFMVQPLYDAIGKLFPKLKHLNDWGEKNCDRYREIIQAYDSELKQQTDK
jgi:hypothetical protein